MIFGSNRQRLVMRMSRTRLGRRRWTPIFLCAAGDEKILFFLFGEVDGFNGLSLSLYLSHEFLVLDSNLFLFQLFLFALFFHL